MANELIDDDSLAKAMENLTEKELAAYNYFQLKKQYPIAEDRAEKFYGLFKNGKSCDDIRKLNPGFGLGQIVAARVTGQWDLHLDNERRVLLERLPSQVMHVQAESLDYMARMIAVNHKLYSEKLDRYLETGDKTYLKDLPKGFGEMKEYRALLETLIKATGQGNRKVIEHHGNVSVSHRGPVSSEEAGNILDVIAIPLLEEKK